MAAIAIVVILIATVVGIVSTSGGHTPAPGAGVAPADFLVSSTQATLDHHSADVTISGAASSHGQTIPINGAGVVDFATGDMSLHLSVSAGPITIDEKELRSAGHFYVTVSGSGTGSSLDISKLTGGANWIEIPAPEVNTAALGAGNVDPLTQIQLLEQKGAKVVSLGSSSVGGDTVSGFAVTPTMAQEEQQLQQEIQAGGLSPSLASQAQQELSSIGTPTFDVYIDGSDLLRQITLTLDNASLGGSTTANLTFSNYGTPVDITPPPSSDVVDYATFLQEAQSTGSTSTGSTSTG